MPTVWVRCNFYQVPTRILKEYTHSNYLMVMYVKYKFSKRDIKFGCVRVYISVGLKPFINSDHKCESNIFINNLPFIQIVTFRHLLSFSFLHCSFMLK